MPKFDYDDIVTAIETAPASTRPGSKAWVVGVLENPRGELLNDFPEGVVYVVEFEDGNSTEINESHLELYTDSNSSDS
jgi:hypothetical protein